MYVCEYVHTHILTYIHTRVSSQALHITVMEIIRIKALYIWQHQARAAAAAAAAWGGRHNDMTFNVLFASISYNSFIQSNEAECADFFSHYSRR